MNSRWTQPWQDIIIDSGGKKRRRRAVRVKCQVCRRRTAVYRVGSDGFGAKSGAKICDNFACRSEASNGYPVTFHSLTEEGER